MRSILGGIKNRAWNEAPPRKIGLAKDGWRESDRYKEEPPRRSRRSRGSHARLARRDGSGDARPGGVAACEQIRIQFHRHVARGERQTGGNLGFRLRSGATCDLG